MEVPGGVAVSYERGTPVGLFSLQSRHIFARRLTLGQALRPHPDYSRANSYPLSPFPPRRTRPGPGPHKSASLAPLNEHVACQGLGFKV